MATLPLIQSAFASLPPTVTTFHFRADTACDNEPTRTWLADPARPGGPAGPIGVTIGADLTRDLHAVCAAVPEAAWQRFEDRLDETVHCTDVECTPGIWKKDAQPLRYVALRIRKTQGQLFASGADTKVTPCTRLTAAACNGAGRRPSRARSRQAAVPQECVSSAPGASRGRLGRLPSPLNPACRLSKKLAAGLAQPFGLHP